MCIMGCDPFPVNGIDHFVFIVFDQDNVNATAPQPDLYKFKALKLVVM